MIPLIITHLNILILQLDILVLQASIWHILNSLALRASRSTIVPLPILRLGLIRIHKELN